MKNFVSKSYIVTIVAPFNLTGGVPVAIGNFVAVPQYDCLKDELTSVLTEGVVSLFVTGNANLGDALYFHNNDNTLSTVSSGGIPCGFALEPAANSETKVMLNKSIVQTSQSIDLSAYLKTSDFNSKFSTALTDATVINNLKKALNIQ